MASDPWLSLGQESPTPCVRSVVPCPIRLTDSWIAVITNSWDWSLSRGNALEMFVVSSYSDPAGTAKTNAYEITGGW